MRNGRMLGVESVLWLILGSASIVFSTWCSLLNLGCSILCAIAPQLRPSLLRSSLWRSSQASNGGDVEGFLMSCTLICLVLHVMSIADNHWAAYSIVGVPIHAYPRSFLALAALLASIGAYRPQPRSLIFLVSWELTFHSIRMYRGMQGVWTFGEWSTVTCFLSIVFSELVSLSDIGLDQAFYIVAAAGTLGCLIACGLSAKVPLLFVRLPLLVITPLVFVEGAMVWCSFDIPPPKCFNWLLVFLLSCENATSACLPRMAWIAYWILVVGIMIPISAHPKFASLAPTVVLRKWFHLVAILLFTPATLLAPQLMTLSYAIALCALMVLECIRPQLPRSIQVFYLTLLDAEKDKPDCVILSHLTLIAGCAFPLWLSVCIGVDSKLLKLWGVAALGVGDSFGAIVGSSWGRTKWGRGRKRSIEGSLAMLLSLGICCSFLGEHWLVIVVFATLLEAFTFQIDNLVLPLAGAGLLGFLSLET